MQHNNSISLDSDPQVKVPSNVKLSATELKVILLAAKGLSNREIASQLNVSRRTIEVHVSNMLNKTSLHTRTELVRWAIESKLVEA
ncbi:MAG TPA: hypothetical protein DCF68_14750 [Cyanothece sp. UBA12306]|nr:hypothetical protein [Cyanothece sp. UBA12306]